MSKSKKADSNRRDQLSYQEFAVRHEIDLAEANTSLGCSAVNSAKTYSLAEAVKLPPYSPLPSPMQELKHTSFFRLLAAAGEENCPDALNFLLYLWLNRMGVRVPEGVFVEPRGTPGRPRSTFGVYRTWLEIGQPPLRDTKLAVAIFGEAFKQVKPAERVKMIDRCRKAVKRHQQRLGQNASK
jgi:hypothetical protein